MNAEVSTDLVVAGSLPEKARQTLAVLDLITANRLASAQSDIHAILAVEGKQQILDLLVSMPKEMNTLLEDHHTIMGDELDDDSKTGLSGFAEEFISSLARNENAPRVDDRSITVDLLAPLHPDRTGSDGDDEAYKQVVAARQNGGGITLQGLYAKVVSEKATADASKMSNSELELKRYKTLIALGAAETTFDSLEAVDEWSERLATVAPYNVRARLWIKLMPMFTKALGVTNRQDVMAQHAEVVEAIDHCLAKFEAIKENPLSDEEIAEFDPSDFDKQLKETAYYWGDVMEDYKNGDGVTMQSGVTFAITLVKLANTFGPFPDPKPTSIHAPRGAHLTLVPPEASEEPKPEPEPTAPPVAERDADSMIQRARRRVADIIRKDAKE